MEGHAKGGSVFRDLVFGIEDGLVSILGVVAGVAIASAPTSTIILAGMAAMFSGAISMAAGTYLSVKSQKELYAKELKREKWEIENMPEREVEEIREIYKAKGFKGKDLDSIVKKITSDKELWLRVMMDEELKLGSADYASPVKSSLVIALAFFIGAVFPITPNFFFSPSPALWISVILTFMALFIFGSLKTRYTQINWVKSGIEMMVIGMLAAGAGYVIGTVFTL